MKRVKRFLSIALAVMLALEIMPLATYAEEAVFSNGHLVIPNGVETILPSRWFSRSDEFDDINYKDGIVVFEAMKKSGTLRTCSHRWK